MTARQNRILRVLWWSSNLLLVAAFVLMPYSCQREYSVRGYLDGFSDAIKPNSLPADQLALSARATSFFLLLRAARAWYADRRFRVPRFHLRENAVRAGAAVLFAPEIKQ